LGFPIFLALPFAFIIHIGFSGPSLPAPKYGPYTSSFDIILSLPALLWSYIPDPFLRIHIANIKRDIHGSDTQTYNVDGNFVEANFETIFADNSAAPNKDSLSFWEALIMIWNNRTAYDWYGPAANAVEWFAAWFILSSADGRMKKEDIKTIYDGSAFFSISKQLAQGKKRGQTSPTVKS